MGDYTCQWNNSLGEARSKRFSVNYIEPVNEITEMSRETIIAIGIAVFLAILLLISVIVGVQMYLKKVSKAIIARKITQL